METLADVFNHGSQSPAVIIPETNIELSFKQLKSLIEQFQQELAKIGLVRGDSVSFALVNGLEFTVAFLASTFQRLVAAPLNPAYKENEFKFYLEDANSKIAIVPKGAVAENSAAVKAARAFKLVIAEIYFDGQKVRLDIKEGKPFDSQKVEQPQADDVALLLHTSGTTGRPKGVPLTHKNIRRTMGNVVETYKLRPTDRTLLVMPLFHVHGLVAGLLAVLLSGGTVVIPEKFSASTFWKHFTANQCTWYTAVPTIHQILLRSPHPSSIPNIRFIRSCSSSLAPSTFHQLEKAFKAPVLEAYAMTEAAHQMTSNPLPPAARKPGTVGLGQGVEVAILDDKGKELPQGKEGEVCIRGINVTKGYINNPSANESSFTKEGFFRTGDQGKKDEDGYVVLTGRIKELINRGGEKISPLEIDAALLEIDGVQEAVSFAVEDEMYGQEVQAAVVPKEGKSLNEKDIQRAVGERIAKFKVPKKVYITDIMPKTATGKIQRRIVAETFLKKAKEGQAKL